MTSIIELDDFMSIISSSYFDTHIIKCLPCNMIIVNGTAVKRDIKKALTHRVRAFLLPVVTLK